MTVSKFKDPALWFSLNLGTKLYTMLKRVLTGGFFAIIFVGLILIFILKKADSFQPAKVSEAVPSSAILFADKLNYSYFSKEFFSSNAFWKELCRSEIFAETDSLLQLFYNRTSLYPVLDQKLEKGALSISIHLLGKSKLSALFYLKLDDEKELMMFENEFVSFLGTEAIINERKYEALSVSDVSLPAGRTFSHFSYVVKDGLFILGSSSMLVEDAIRSLNSGGAIEDEKGFKIVENIAGKYVHANVYINYRLFNHLLFPLLNNANNFRLKSLNDFAHWGEFDADLNNESFVLNGMTYVNDSLAGWLSLFKGQDAVKVEAPSFVPSGISEMVVAGISDVDVFKSSLISQLKLFDQYPQFRASREELERIIGSDPIDDLLEILRDEIVWFTLGNSAEGKRDELVIYELKSKSEALERLSIWVSNLAASEGKTLDDYTSKYVLDDQTTFNIYELNRSFYKGTFPGKFIKKRFSFYDNYLIFSDSEEAISRTIYQNVLRKTLENDPTFGEVSHLISSRANLTFYISPEPKIVQSVFYLKDEYKDALTSLEQLFRKIPGLIIQYSNEGNIFYSGIGLKYSHNIKEKALTEWESLLDSSVSSKPVLVSNHYTSEKEIMVQDASGALYLMNGTGRILWKVKLDSPIMGEIYQVDYYQNGKLQYMFNTKEGLHLLDRNGNYVERYPIRFRSDATNGVVLFDYDKRNDYRIFVACEDKHVYVYNLEGNIVPGWTFKKTEGIVTNPIQHFRVKEKDYIVFSDGLRSYILDRRGKERVKQKDLLMVSKNSRFYLDMNIAEEQPRFLASDTSGRVVAMNLNGESKVLLEKRHSPEHFFFVKDLDHDGKFEYVFADGKELEALNSDGKSLFSFKIKSDISKLPDIYQFSTNDLKIGVTDVDRNKIYLLNSDGTVYEGFPLDGCTRFSIGYFAGSDSRFNLIVGSKDGFLYNYSIE